MKRITIYVAFLAAVSLLGSCKDMKDLSEPSSVDQVKTIQVYLGSVTKAVSESAVNDATLFVYQNNSKTGESVLYHQVYGPGSTFEVDLLFSDQTTYTYDIKAYANMGELAAEGGEVLFTGESESGLQLHGQSLSVGEADASAVTVDMSRYVGKVTVSKVAVDWTNDHGQQDLKLVSVYLANVPGKVGGEPEYNVGGGFFSSAMDALIYRPVGSLIADGESYATAQSMYGYAGTDCALVLECELSGEKMYYHVPYSPEANTHRAFSFTIRQNGADTPLGELAQEALEVSVVTLNVLGYDESEGDVDFGEDKVKGLDAKILHINGSLYTAEEWNIARETGNVTVSDAVGIAIPSPIRPSEYGFMIHPTAIYHRFNMESLSDLQWSSNITTLVSKVYSTSFLRTEIGKDIPAKVAVLDYNGRRNTEAVLAAVNEGIIEDAPAFRLCYETIFAHGQTGYLPAAGELIHAEKYNETIEECKAAITGYEDVYVFNSNSEYWSSTQHNEKSVWVYSTYDSSIHLFMNTKNVEDSVMPFCEYPGNENELNELLPSVPYIYTLDRNFYTSDEWHSTGLSKDNVIGIAITYGNNIQVVLHPTAVGTELTWADKECGVIDGIYYTNDPAIISDPYYDFDGKSNTDAIIAAIDAGVIDTAPAAQFCVNTTFANGKKGHLPSGGELAIIIDNKEAINQCLEICGFNIIPENGYIWSSTQCKNGNAWSSTAYEVDYNHQELTTHRNTVLVVTNL